MITGEYPPMEGGVGAFTRELARALAAAGHEPHILTDQRAAGAADRGIHHHPRVQNWNRAFLSGGVGRWLRKIAPAVVNLQYEAAAFGMSGAVNLAPLWLPSLPLITTFHDLLPPYLFPKAGGLRQRAVFFLARRSAAVIATNGADESALRAAGCQNLRLIPIGSNIPDSPPPDYDRGAWRSRLNTPPQTFLVGYFGFLNATKGMDTLLHGVRGALAGVPDLRLLLIGGRTGTSDAANAAIADAIDGQIAALGLGERVIRTGFVDEAAVSAHLHACDTLVLPYSDGVSYRRGSFMAGLAHGCPIVTTHPRKVLPELHNGENVTLIPPDDPAALAATLRTLAADPDLRSRLGAGARVLSQRFGWESIAAQTAALFAETVT